MEFASSIAFPMNFPFLFLFLVVFGCLILSTINDFFFFRDFTVNIATRFMCLSTFFFQGILRSERDSVTHPIPLIGLPIVLAIVQRKIKETVSFQLSHIRSLEAVEF